jgi:2-dehydropantoate 2-reductase
MNSFPNFLIAFLLWVFSRITSMRELLATGLNECRALIDTMVAAAAKAKPPLPAAVKAVLAIKPTEGSSSQKRVGQRLAAKERS